MDFNVSLLQKMKRKKKKTQFLAMAFGLVSTWPRETWVPVKTG